MLILIGQYAQLSNISDEHHFIEDFCFVVGGKEFFHKAGEKTLLMYKWVVLRREARLNKDEKTLMYFAQFADILQQPSGFEDAIISKMIIVIQAKAYPVKHSSERYVLRMPHEEQSGSHVPQSASSHMDSR